MKKESPQSDVAPDSPKSVIEKEEMQRRRAEFFKKKGTKKYEFYLFPVDQYIRTLCKILSRHLEVKVFLITF